MNGRRIAVLDVGAIGEGDGRAPEALHVDRCCADAWPVTGPHGTDAGS